MPVAGIRDSLPTYQQQKLALAADLLRTGSTLQLKVRGASMMPALRPGEIVTIAPVDCRQLRSGDIVFLVRNSKALVHRIQTRVETPEGPRGCTRGDAVSTPDAPARPNEILGKVVSVLRGHQHLTLPSHSDLLNQVLAWVFRHSDFSLRLALRLHSSQHPQPSSPNASPADAVEEPTVPTLLRSES